MTLALQARVEEIGEEHDVEDHAEEEYDIEYGEGEGIPAFKDDELMAKLRRAWTQVRRARGGGVVGGSGGASNECVRGSPLKRCRATIAREACGCLLG